MYVARRQTSRFFSTIVFILAGGPTANPRARVWDTTARPSGTTFHAGIAIPPARGRLDWRNHESYWCAEYAQTRRGSILV